MSVWIVAASTMDPELRERIDRYNRDCDRLGRLEDRVESDRISNRYRTGGWFSAPPPPIETSSRELEALRLARELELERAAIGGLCPIWDRLGGEPSRPKGT